MGEHYPENGKGSLLGMSRQLEQAIEEKSARRHLAILKAVEYDLERSVAESGGHLTGLGVKLTGGDCLITLRANLGGEAKVSFVGAGDFGDALIKAVREIRSGKLRWREDLWAGK